MQSHRVYDRIHGEVQLPPLASLICGTPEFSRLASIRQLGSCSFVYPGACHTRYEHSLNVCHLAGKVGRHLQTQFAAITDDDVLCVEIAALIHDLGHGAFSHQYEHYVHEATGSTTEFSHEVMGLDLFDLLLARHPEIDFPSHFADRAAAAEHLAFVKLLVLGLAPADAWPAKTVGRPETKRFLVDLVHNKTCGIDVDRMSYLLLDAASVLGASHSIDLSRIIAGMRVVEHDNRVLLAFDEAIAFNIVELFTMRAKLHAKLYQYRTVKVVERLFLDLMATLDACLPEGERLIDARHDPSKFVDLTDASVMNRPYLTDATLAPARAAWGALFRRPWLVRVPVTACLRTTPGCAECGAATAIADRFCRQCGASTRTRASVGLADGLLVPPECTITPDEATRELRARLGHEDARVFLTEVHVGSQVRTTDPHGRTWRDYDPLRNVVFCDRQGRKTLHLHDGALFHVPASCHVRTAHCYLPLGASDEAVAQATDAFREWATTVGDVLEEEWA